MLSPARMMTPRERAIDSKSAVGVMIVYHADRITKIVEGAKQQKNSTGSHHAYRKSSDFRIFQINVQRKSSCRRTSLKSDYTTFKAIVSYIKISERMIRFGRGSQTLVARVVAKNKQTSNAWLLASVSLFSYLSVLVPAVWATNIMTKTRLNRPKLDHIEKGTLFRSQ